jgi:hypothetical protein
MDSNIVERPAIPVHARDKDTNEILCGKPGLSLDRWSGTAEEITCPDCNAKIPRFTAEEMDAGIDAALLALMQSKRDA